MIIRFILAAIATFSLTVTAFAQKDSINIHSHSEVGELEKQTFIDEYDFVFLNKEPLRFMAKWNAAAALPVLSTDWQLLGGGEGFDNFRLEAALEVRIAPAFSVNGLVSAEMAGEDNNFFDNVVLGLEPRYYFNQKRRIRQGKSANNLTGAYVGAAMSRETNLFKFSFLPPGEPYNFHNYAAYLRAGFQQRIFKSGYIDFSWGLGAQTITTIIIAPDQQVSYLRKWREQFNQRLTMGWAFGSPKTGKRENRSCDFFKCYREENSLLKIDLLNLVRQLNFQQQSGKISLAYERKIGGSPFSIQVGADVLAAHIRQNENVIQKGIGGGASLESRWYYSLKKRIATGKSGNNLSGHFVGLHVGYSASKETNLLIDIDPIFINRSLRVVPIWGMQYRIFNTGFFEYRVGVGLSNYYSDTDYFRPEPPIFTDPPSFTGNELTFLSELKIGFAF
jgi:hypothetical protein